MPTYIQTVRFQQNEFRSISNTAGQNFAYNQPLLMKKPAIVRQACRNHLVNKPSLTFTSERIWLAHSTNALFIGIASYLSRPVDFAHDCAHMLLFCECASYTHRALHTSKQTNMHWQMTIIPCAIIVMRAKWLSIGMVHIPSGNVGSLIRQRGQHCRAVIDDSKCVCKMRQY